MRIFIYCADPRDQANLEEKISQKLLEPGERIIRISIFGGPICLAHQEDLREEVDCLMKQIRFAGKTFPDVNEIVLVGHDCGYYANIFRPVNGQTKKDDLIKGVGFLKKHVRNVHVSAYYYAGAEDEVIFEEIVGAESSRINS